MRLLIDISGLAYRAAHKVTLSHGGQNTNVVFGVLRTLEALAVDLQPEEMAICWDAGKDARRALYPEYKANRKKDPEFDADFRQQMGFLLNVLNHLPVTQVVEQGVEADDVIAALCVFTKCEQVAIVSGDHDLYQLVDPPKRIMVDHTGNPVRLDLKPKQVVAYKCLVGDSSDNIKGVLGVGDKKARELLREHRSLKRILAWAKETGEPLGRMTYREARPIVARNVKLIRLDGQLLTEEQQVSIVGQYRDKRVERFIDERELRGWFEQLGFRSTLKRMPAFLRAFAGLVRQRGDRQRRRHEEEAVAHRAQGGTPATTAERADAGPATKRWRIVKRVKRWRIVKRVVDEAGRATQGVGSGGAQESAQLATRDGHGGPPRAVPGVVQQARERRLRRADTGLPPLSEIPSPERVRRDSALSMLSAFEQEPGWVKGKETKTLKRVSRLIDAFAKDANHSPSETDLKWLQALHYEFTMEMPEWMLTNRERRKRKEQAA